MTAEIPLVERPRQQVGRAGVNGLGRRNRIGRVDDADEWQQRMLRPQDADRSKRGPIVGQIDQAEREPPLSEKPERLGHIARLVTFIPSRPSRSRNAGRSRREHWTWSTALDSSVPCGVIITV